MENVASLEARSERWSDERAQKFENRQQAALTSMRSRSRRVEGLLRNGSEEIEDQTKTTSNIF